MFHFAPVRVAIGMFLACFIGVGIPAPALAKDSPATERLKARNVDLRKDVIKVTDGVYTAVGYTPANVSMIVGKTGLIIVDTGMMPDHAQAILAEFRKISSLPVKAIIYTHSHGDHTGGTSAFVGDGHPDIWARSNFGSEGGAFTSAGLTIQNPRGARQAGFKLPSELRINNGVAPAMNPKQGGAVFTGELGLVSPTKTFSEARKSIEVAGVKLDLVADPGETEDALYPKRKSCSAVIVSIVHGPTCMPYAARLIAMSVPGQTPRT